MNHTVSTIIKTIEFGVCNNLYDCSLSSWVEDFTSYNMHVSVCVMFDITMKNFILATLQHKELLKEFKTSKLSSLVQTIKTKFRMYLSGNYL